MSDEAKEGYRTAIQMISYEGGMIWSSFTALLGANVFLIALIGSILKFFPNFYYFKYLPTLGIPLCLIWMLITRRDFAFYKYWFACAREYEEKGFGDTVRIVREGRKYGKGKSVIMGGDTLRLAWFTRVNVQWLIYSVITIFIAVYFLFLVTPLSP